MLLLPVLVQIRRVAPPPPSGAAPPTQAPHAVAPSADEYLPAGHMRHHHDGLSENEPGRHGRQALEALSEYHPAPHREHAVAPVALE